jgi:hypothetical protein
VKRDSGAHPSDQSLERLSLGRMTTVESLRAQRHLFNCAPCLKRLLAIEVQLAIGESLWPEAVPTSAKPLFVRHDTGDGFIYSRVEQRGRFWLSRHWGAELDGIRKCRTMREANEFAMESFRQMFPEHCCTARCMFNPPMPRAALSAKKLRSRTKPGEVARSGSDATETSES